MSEAILKTEKLNKTFFTGGAEQRVLRDVDLEIYKGDFTVIMGASGGGKSTLLYALSGMDAISGGRLYFDGVDISGYGQDKLAVFRRGRCGFVFQQSYLVESMSVLDNILVSALLSEKNKKTAVEKSKKMLLDMNLSERDFKKQPHMLSGGEAQRVGIARACVNEPQVLFADEPTGALNSETAAQVLDVLSALNRAGQSTVMVTHDLNSALRANRILFLKDGVIEGELHLSAYGGEEQKRRGELKNFLAKMGW